MRGIRKIFAVSVALLLLTLTSCFPLSFALSRAPRTHRATSGSNKHLSVKQKQSHLLLATTRMPRSDGAENSLLIDEDETREFCRSFLMPYGNARSFKVMARNKYAGGQLSRNRFQVERHTLNFHASSSSSRQMEDELIRCIHRTEVLAAAEMYRDGNDLPIVADWMGCYVSAYPLDVEDACDAFIALILKHRTERRRALVNQKSKEVHEELLLPALQQPVSKFESLLQQSSNLQHRLLKLDVDTKDPELIRSLHLAMRDCKCALAVETRGGFHVVIERGPAVQALWKFAQDINKDVPTEKQWITLEESCGCLVAVPGTKQGGFTARLKTDEWREALGDKRR